MKEAGIGIISLPLTNLHLQGRARGPAPAGAAFGPPRTPQWRGLTLLHEFIDAGVTVACGGDNVRDAFIGWGDFDLVEVYVESVRLAHLDTRLAYLARGGHHRAGPDHGAARLRDDRPGFAGRHDRLLRAQALLAPRAALDPEEAHPWRGVPGSLAAGLRRAGTLAPGLAGLPWRPLPQPQRVAAGDPTGTPAPRARVNLRYLVPICLAATLGGLLFGYDTGVISGAIEPLTARFGLGDFMKGWSSGCVLIGCAGGVLLVGPLSDRFGRKPALLLSAVMFFASAIGTALPRDIAIFIVFRILGGVGIGIASISTPMYIAEVTPAHIRGRMVAANQIAVVVGLAATSLVNYFIARPRRPGVADRLGLALDVRDRCRLPRPCSPSSFSRFPRARAG